MSREIEVWADWQELGSPILMGHLRSSLSFDLALEVASYFRLKRQAAEAILREVRDAVATWKKLASELGIARSEQEIMAAAFEV